MQSGLTDKGFKELSVLCDTCLGLLIVITGWTDGQARDNAIRCHYNLRCGILNVQAKHNEHKKNSVNVSIQ